MPGTLAGIMNNGAYLVASRETVGQGLAAGVMTLMGAITTYFFSTHSISDIHLEALSNID